MSIIEKITNEFIIKVTSELNKEENQNKINYDIIRPLLNLLSTNIINEFYPFIIFGSIIFILTFIFVFIILILIFKK